MSAEHFSTFLTCDMKTAADNRGVEIAEGGKGVGPRWIDSFGPHADPDARGGWAECYMHSEGVLQYVAEVVRTDVMDGLTGDHPAERKHLADIIDTVAVLVRDLALDAAHDGSFTREDWQDKLDKLERVVRGDELADPRRCTFIVHHPERPVGTLDDETLSALANLDGV